MHPRSLALVSVCAGSLLLCGCVTLSEGVSKSISSPFEWASDSSQASSDAISNAYQGDVTAYTDTFVRGGGDLTQFMDGLRAVAARHGISNWAADADTYVAVGRGLKKGHATAAELATYTDGLAHGDALKAARIQAGFDAAS